MINKNNMYPQNGVFLDENGEKNCIVTILKNIAAGSGSGAVIELQKGETHIEWKYSNEEDWKQLISLEELKGERGEQGPQGPTGEQGPAGAEGKGWLFGTNAPDAGLGRNGDLYYKHDTCDVYRKNDGQWQLSQNIKGEDGATPPDASTETKGIVKMASAVGNISTGNVDAEISGTQSDETLNSMRTLLNETKNKLNEVITKLKQAGIIQS